MTNAFSGMPRYLALLFPFLPTDRLRIEQADRYRRSPEAPLVLFARTGNALRLTAVDTLGLRLKLAAGMTLADARVRCPKLTAIEHDDAADRHWLERMGQDCIRFTPRIALLPPDSIGLDITGVVHLFGGERAMVDLVTDRFTTPGMHVRSACSQTLEAAQALARYTDRPVTDEPSAIRALPVQALGLDEETTRGLQRAGLKTVGAVAIRPMAMIAARFGIEAVIAIERLLGKEQAPIITLTPQQPLRVERRFADPVTHQDVIAKVLLELLQEAVRALEERGGGGRRFRLELRRSDGTVHALDISTGAPTRDPALVLRLFNERIGTLADPFDPGFGYDSMLLSVPGLEPLAAAQTTFNGAIAGNDGAEQDVAELIDRLSVRLGPSAVRRIVPRDSHLPERAQRALPAIECALPAPWSAASQDGPPLRPLFLFNPPQIVDVIAEVPDGPPHRFRWRRTLHEVRLYEGPERIAAEWWRQPGGKHTDQSDLTRDYYRVEDRGGQRFWIFRHGLYAEKPDPHWYLHGLFA